MSDLAKRLLFWTPRVLSLAFIAFLSLFALDVFGEHLGFWRTIVALCRHLIPSFVLLAALVLAWRWEWIGAVLYAGFGGLYTYFVVHRPHPLSMAVQVNWILVIAAPAF